MSIVTPMAAAPPTADPERGPQPAGPAERRADRAEGRQRDEGHDDRDRRAPASGAAR